MKEAVSLLEKSNKILILTHKNPDGDAVGSVLGFAEALEKMGKEVECFSKDNVPEVLRFLPGASRIKKNIPKKNYDLVILLDCSLFSRSGLENINEITDHFDGILVVDHHPKDRSECDSNKNCASVIDEKASSAAILVYGILKRMNVKINKDIATCLLTGIFTDTGSFQHNNTDPQSLEAAAEFIKKGSRIDKIAKNIFSGKNIQAIKLWGKALSRIQKDDKTGMAVSYVSKKDIEDYGVKHEDLSGLVSVINTVSDAKFSLLLTEYENEKIRGSLRSDEYKGVDVSRIARSLGGGGHRLASGFEVNGDIKENISKIKEMISSGKNDI